MLDQSFDHNIRKESIVDTDTGEIVGEVYYHPDAVGLVHKPYRLVIGGQSLGFHSTKEAIHEIINSERRKAEVSAMSR